MQRLQAITWPWSDAVVIKEMNWGPIAIVQDLQADPVSYDRVVLVSAVERGSTVGSVSCRRWQPNNHAALDPVAVQQRVYEGVTGIISVDNLLVIGEYFKVWPDEVITVEVELPEHVFGDLVLAEMALEGTTVVGEKPLSSEGEEIVHRMVKLTECAAIEGVGGLSDLETLDLDQLKPVGAWCQNRFSENGLQ